MSCGCGASPAIEPSSPAAVGLAGEPRAGQSILLVDAGAAPRRSLRLRFLAGTTEFIELAMRLRMVLVTSDAKLGRHEDRTEAPPARITMRVDTREVLQDGQAVTEFTVERVRVADDVIMDPLARAGLEAKLAESVGLRVRGRLSPLGVPSEIEFAVPPGTSAAQRQQLQQLKDSLDKLYIRLPEQPIGVGATWIVTSRSSVAGITADVRYRCTLTQLDGTSARFAVVLAFAAVPPVMRIDGDTTTFESLTGGGKSSVVMYWDHLVPTSALTSSVDGSFTVASSDGSKVHATLHFDVDLASWPGKHTENACDHAEIQVSVERGVRLRHAKRFATANSLFERACSCHDADGCGNLAFSYLEGAGVTADPARAVQLFDQACGSDTVPAAGAAGFCFMLGSLYQIGRGASRDLAAALALYRRACDGGWPEGCSRAGSLLEDGIGTPRDGTAALAAYKRGCDGRDALGCLSLSLVYQKGKFGTKRNLARASELKERACEICAQTQCTFMPSVCRDKP